MPSKIFLPSDAPSIPVAVAVPAADATAGETGTIAMHGGMHGAVVTKTEENNLKVEIYNTHTGDRFACIVDEATIRSKPAGNFGDSLFIGHPPPPLQDPDQLGSLLNDALSGEAPDGTLVTCNSKEMPGESFSIQVDVMMGSGWAAVQFGVRLTAPLVQRASAETKLARHHAAYAAFGPTAVLRSGLLRPVPTSAPKWSRSMLTSVPRH